MMDNHCHAIRFYDSSGDGIARSWIVPYNEKMFFCFNGYGYDLILQVRILSLYLGLSYKKVDLDYNGNVGDTIWINSNSGYVLGKTEDITSIDKIQFTFREDSYKTCENCGTLLLSEQGYLYNGDYYCQSCYDEYFTTCDDCGESCHRNDTRTINGLDICPTCYHSDRYYRCDRCGDYHAIDDTPSRLVKRLYRGYSGVETYTYCQSCFDYKLLRGYLVTCDHCQTPYYRPDDYVGGVWNCPTCEDLIKALHFAESDPIRYAIEHEDD